MRKIFTTFALMLIYCVAISANFTAFSLAPSPVPKGNVEVNATAGTVGPILYTTLKAAFDAINLGTHQGVITVKINASISETASAVINASGSGTAPNTSSYLSVTIYPTVTGLTLSGAIDGPLVDMNGADNVIIDGRVNNTGLKDLTIVNTSATVNNALPISTIRFINSAENNKIKYCTIKASALSTISGIILFSTASAINGNSGNRIDNCDLSQDASRPYRVVYSLGTSGYENIKDTVSNCNIYNFFKSNSTSNGIFISSNSSDWTITSNNLYETTPVVPVGAYTYYFIRVDNNLGNNFTISDNFIGGTASNHTGKWTVYAAFGHAVRGIYLNVGTTTASTLQNNTIQGITYTSTAATPFCGLYITGGDVNVGTTTGNVIGTAASPITVTGSNANAITYGIYTQSMGTVSIQNNSISSITTFGSATTANSFTGIHRSFGTGTTTISNNLVGSASVASSIYASSASTGSKQSVIGISCEGTDSNNINGNTVANLTNGPTDGTTATTGQVIGIASYYGANTMTNNNVYNLTITNKNESSTDMCVKGINVGGNSIYAQNVSGNTIHHLSNGNTTFAGHVAGIYLSLPNLNASTVTRNFIYNLSVHNSSNGASVYGIKIGSGLSTYSNNIISLGGNTATTLYGIYETGDAGNNNNLYFNTVYLSGTQSGFQPSYALYSAVSTNTRDFRNNIFHNARTSVINKAPGSDPALHFAAYFAANTGTITCDYNDYYVATTPGSGSMLGYFGGNKNALPIVTGMTGNDEHSEKADPIFASGGGTLAANYKPSEPTLVGVAGTGILKDYIDATRNTTYPAMGAWEYTVTPPCTNPSSGGTISATRLVAAHLILPKLQLLPQSEMSAHSNINGKVQPTTLPIPT